MAHGDTPHGPGPAFDVVLRGYDRRQVDDHIAALESRLASTSNQSHELRLQRDAAASRAGELEQRLSGGAGGPSTGSTGSAGGSRGAGAPSRTAPSSPMDDAASLDGLGAKVESILRVATEQAASIRRSAEDSGRMHAEAEVRLRATFEGIAERLHPLVGRLDEESTTARAAITGTTDEATALESTARQQAEAMVAAAGATATRMRKAAESRVDITARQVADVREELALVRQILDSLATPSAAPTTTGADAAADATGPLQVSGPGASAGDPPGSGQKAGPGLASRLSKPVGSFPGNGQPASAARGANAKSGSSTPPAPSTPAGAPRGAVDLQPPARAAAGPGRQAGEPGGFSPDAPTETIALPQFDSAHGQRERDAEATGRSQPPG